MIAVQRHRRIVEYVHGHGAGRVADLARAFDVTEETIRRDLRVLADQGALARTHGGAVPIDADDARADLPYLRRDATNTAAKAAIARTALPLVAPGSIIALDASSTAGQLARQLPDEPLTVVTNCYVICALLARRRNIEVVCTGGTLDAEAMAFTGLFARRTLQTFNIDTVFFSCRGIDLERGFSESNEAHAAVKLAMIEAARQRVLLADTTKLGVASKVFVGPVTLADRVIVERSEHEGVQARIARLRALGIAVDEAAPSS